MNLFNIFKDYATPLVAALLGLLTWYSTNKKSNHDILKDDIVILCNQLQEMKSENRSLRNDIDKLKTENEKLKQQVDSIQQED